MKFFKKSAAVLALLLYLSTAAFATGGSTSPFVLLGLSNTWTGTQTLPVAGLILGAKTPIVTVTRQVFTANGTYTPTTGMLFADVELCGAGGGGGGANGAGAAGGGGGAGGYSRRIVTAANVGASQAVTIGAAGTAGASTGATGGTGGTTSLGALLQATGGAGGVGSTAAAVNAVAGGLGGVGSGGDINLTGQSGTYGFEGSISATVVFFRGGGGSSPFGAGAPQVWVTTSSGAGAAGTDRCSGGGGASGTTSAGSVGTAGYIAITEYVNR